MNEDPIKRDGLKPEFWKHKPLKSLSPKEWEALCDGCGKCCLNKLEDEDTGEVALTRIACRLLDDQSCKCGQYPIRHQFIPDCIVLKPSNIDKNVYWMPKTCAYRLLWSGQPLFDWHPLISGDPETVHTANISVRGITLSEFDINEEDWEDHIIEEPL
ncbi:MAG: YcgN family cysteine cluster protein [Rhodobacteraceae bacterium]|nr:YcgN family cysteine cluster protein [Paracoccaceae bacterium]MBT6300489.1 YcgN family cysteine cluster protein [Paracoccaceae bacterium]